MEPLEIDAKRPARRSFETSCHQPVAAIGPKAIDNLGPLVALTDVVILRQLLTVGAQKGDRRVECAALHCGEHNVVGFGIDFQITALSRGQDQIESLDLAVIGRTGRTPLTTLG